MRVAEVDLDAGRQLEALVPRHFRAAIPGQGAVELMRQAPSMSGQGRSHGVRVFGHRLDQHHLARASLHQGRDLAMGIAEQQVAFPVPWHGPVFYTSWAFADGDGIDDSAMNTGLL